MRWQLIPSGQIDSLTVNYSSRIFLDGANITARVEYARDTIRPAIREKIRTQCQGLYDAAQKLGKTAYLCDSPLHLCCALSSRTDDPFRPFRLNARGEFKNPSLKALADLFIGIMIAHGCDPDVAKNLVYSS